MPPIRPIESTSSPWLRVDSLENFHDSARLQPPICVAQSSPPANSDLLMSWRRTRAKARDYIYAGCCPHRCKRGLKPATTYMQDVVLTDVVAGFSPRKRLKSAISSKNFFVGESGDQAEELRRRKN